MKDIIITGITILGGGIITIIVTMIQNRKLDKKPALNGGFDKLLNKIEKTESDIIILKEDVAFIKGKLDK